MTMRALAQRRILTQNRYPLLLKAHLHSRFLPMIRGMTAPSFMDLALKTAENAGKSGEVPIGCVIVRDYEVIATAGNRTLTDRDPTAHAEILAIRQAAEADRHRAAGRLRSLCHAGAVHDVRRRDLVRADPAALLRRGRSQGRRGRIPACGSLPRRPAITCRRSIPRSAKARRRRCCGSFSRRGGEVGARPNTAVIIREGG